MWLYTAAGDLNCGVECCAPLSGKKTTQCAGKAEGKKAEARETGGLCASRAKDMRLEIGEKKLG